MRTSHTSQALQNLDQLFNFIIKERSVSDADRFATACWKLYNENFSKRRRIPDSPRGVTSNSSSKGQLPATPSTTPRLSSATSQQLARPMPPLQPEVIDLDQTDDMITDLTINAPTPPKQPVQISLRFQHPRIIARLKLYDKARTRYQTFHSPLSQPPNNHASETSLTYIWPSSHHSNHYITLHFDVICPAMLDRTGLLSDVHLNALRFLWFHLIHDSCTGAVFNHGIGYPKAHLVFLFAHLVKKSPQHQTNKILVVYPEHSLPEWKRAMPHFKDTVQVTLLKDGPWQTHVAKWTHSGGVMLISDVLYGSMLSDPDSDRKVQALEALCRPGPDVVILDEASRLATNNGHTFVYRMLSRTQTTARLAMTSVPLAGNITRAWHVVNFACPTLFGSLSEYWDAFVRPIADGLGEDSSVEKAHHSLQTARLLYHNLAVVTCTIEPQQRKHVISNRSYHLNESTLTLQLHREDVVAYQEIEVLLNEALTRRAISPFVAAHILVCAACSLRALADVLKNLSSLSDEAFDAYNVSNQRENLRQLSRKLGDIVDRYSRNDPTKLVLALIMSKECVKRGDRLVLFASSHEVQMDAYRYLKSKMTPDAVHMYDLRVPHEIRTGELDKFNTKSSGAILVAPYGPTIDCMEDAGWGFVNATRVLFLDISWHLDACIQAFHRVHNFAQLNPVVHVHHFVAEDTIEMALFGTVSKRYEDFAHHIRANISFEPVKIPQQTGFLLPSAIPRGWIRRAQDQDSKMLRCTETKIMRAEHPMSGEGSETSLDNERHESLISPLQTINAEEGSKIVSQIMWGTNRYEVMSEVLDSIVRCQLGEDHDLRPVIQSPAGGSTVSTYFKNRLEQIWACVESQSEEMPLAAADQFFLEPKVSVCHLLSCWSGYQRVFERVESQNDNRPPPQKRQRLDNQFY